ncbi:MAG: adenylate/guanylate cyclase domain-containing protein [Aquificaceae bacterium]
MPKVALVHILGAILGALLYLGAPAPLESIKLRAEDILYRAKEVLGRAHRPDANLAIVAIDEKSINELGRWPWDRQVIAKLVENLSHSRVVAFDIVFSEPAVGDRELAEAISGAGNVVLGFFLRKEASDRLQSSDFDLLLQSELLRVKRLSDRVFLEEFPNVETNVNIIAGSSLMQAPFNSRPDPDGLYRRYPVAFMFKGHVFPSMAFQVFRLYKNQDIELVVSNKGIKSLKLGNENIPASNYILLNFPRFSSVEVFSAVDVIKGRKIPPKEVIFVGATEIGIYDIRPTPIDYSTPGVFLHYTALSNILKRDFITVNKSAGVFYVVFGTVLSLPVFFIRRLKRRIYLATSALVLILSVGVLSFAYFNFYLPVFYSALAFLFSYVASEGLMFSLYEFQTSKLKRAFSSYLSPELLELVIKNPESLKLGGQKRYVTVLFSDLRGFTTMSESLDPEVLVNVLNRYLEPMTLIVLEERGMLDKYIGDAIMAIFNAPIEVEDHPSRACKSALRMLEKLKELNEGFRKDFGIELSIGVGINTGYAVIGNMGSSVRFDYTAIGDTVNTASRLEGLNKFYKTSIIISESTAREIEDRFLLRMLDKVAVKGKAQATTIYELMLPTETNMKIKELYEAALEFYFRGIFKEAERLFSLSYEQFNDGPSLVLLERSRYLLANPPEEWEGIYIAREK